MRALKLFDPWKSKLCTCPPKLTLNPYTGCSHACLYCYASSYIKNFFKCRSKSNLIPSLLKDSKELNGELISISNSSDPYVELERKLKLTRKCLEILSKANCRVQIVTKSDLVVRDVDILKKMKSMVTLTVTTLNEKISKKLEPRAPLPKKRIKALAYLVKRGIKVSVRIDPIIPFLNEDQEKLIKKLGEIGVLHITSSTYKVKPDNWRRMCLAFPSLTKKLKKFYFEEGEKIGNYFYLSKKMRFELMKKIKELVEENGMKFGCCREGFPKLNSATCDGSWLIE